MKFFTLDWWIANDGDPFPAYAAHVASIARLLPADLLRLAQDQTCWLHDSRLRELTFDAGTGDLTLRFDTPDGQGGFTRRLDLQYRRVEGFKSVADPKKGLLGPHGYGDLGYDEIDVAGSALVHRLLFSTGIEFEIQFRDFSLAARLSG